MTSQNRQSETTPLFSAFERAPYRYSFYQAVRILEGYFQTTLARHRLTPSQMSPIRFKPDNSMTFPSSDVKAVEIAEDRASLIVTFMGLYGAASPLPPVFSEDTIADGEALRDFLDIFDSRLCAFYFEAWERNRPELTDVEQRRRVVALGGVDSESNATLSSRELLPFVGLLGTTARNAAGLEAIVTGLTGIPTSVEENIARWVTITDPPGLGSKAKSLFRLGVTSTLGRHMPDASGKFKLTMGPLTLNQYRALLPGGQLANRVVTMVNLYLQDDLAFDVCLQLTSSEVTPVELGKEGYHLGLNTWVGSPTTPVSERTVTYKD